MAIVIDASVALAWYLPNEQGNARADAVAVQIAREQALVPPIFWYEVRNILVRSERQGRIDPVDTRRFLGQLNALGIEMDLAHDELIVLELARRHRLSVYDAAYLETALRRRARIATLDNAIAAASFTESVDNLIG